MTRISGISWLISGIMIHVVITKCRNDNITADNRKYTDCYVQPAAGPESEDLLICPDGSEYVLNKSGPAGEPGKNGKNEEDGRDGTEGEKGQNGKNGEQGLEGKNGERGEPGAAGAPGPAGPAGQDGKDGEKGDDGSQGPKGPVGDIGPRGPAGPAGENSETEIIFYAFLCECPVLKLINKFFVINKNNSKFSEITADKININKNCSVKLNQSSGTPEQVINKND